jgi:hypothetical protein
MHKIIVLIDDSTGINFLINEAMEDYLTLSLILSEKHRLRVFVNRVLRRIFDSKTDELTRDWRKLHNEELHNLYSSTNIIRMIK